MSNDKLYPCKAKGCNNKFRKFKSTDKYCSYSCASKSEEPLNKSPLKPKGWTPEPMSEKAQEKIRKREEKRKKKQAENAIKLRQRAAEKQKKKLMLSGKPINLNKKKKSSWSPQVARRKKMTEDDKLFEKAKLKVKHRVKVKYGRLRCERCKTATSIQFSVHHIIFRSERPKHEHLHNTRNLLFLCFDCHEWFHKRKRNRNKWIKELKLWELFGSIWGHDDFEENESDNQL